MNSDRNGDAVRRRVELSNDEVARLLRSPTLSVGEAAGVLRVGEVNLRRQIESGSVDLPVLAIGSRRVIPTAAVKRLLGIEP